MSWYGEKCDPILFSTCKHVQNTISYLFCWENVVYLRFGMTTHSICAIHSVATLGHLFSSTNTVRCIWKCRVVFFEYDFQAPIRFIYARTIINNLTYKCLLTTTKKAHSLLSKRQNFLCFQWSCCFAIHETALCYTKDMEKTVWTEFCRRKCMAKHSICSYKPLYLRFLPTIFSLVWIWLS